MTLNWQNNDYFGLLLYRDKRSHAALEMLVDDLHAEKEKTISKFLCHSGSEDFLWGLVRLLGSTNTRVAGNSAYIIGTLAESDLGCFRVISLTSSSIREAAKILPDLTNMLTFDDSESVMNAAGTMGTLAESHEGRMWMLGEDCLTDTLTNVTALLKNDNLWTASNAALVLARLTIAEEGCERILAHRNSEHILSQLTSSLGVDEAGRGMNAAFAIGRLCDMEWGRNRLLSLPESEKMITSLTKMLCCDDAGASKNACFALSCLATNKEGHTRLLKNSHSEEVLKTLAELLSAEDAETGWFAAMTLRTLASQPKGCLRLRDHSSIIPALKATQENEDVSQDLMDEVVQTLEILKRLEKAPAPMVEVLGSNSVHVTWPAVPTKSGFPVRYHLYEEGRCVYQGREVEHHTSNLKPHTNYSYRLRAITDGDEGPLSDPVTIMTEESTPSPVQNLRVMGVTTTQLKVAWDPPELINGILRGYALSAGKTTEHTNDLQYIFTGLTPNTSYEIQVAAHTSKGKGPRESVVGTTSELGAHAPSKPEVLVRGRNELHVSWRAPEVPLGRITRYDLLMDGDAVYSGTDLHYTVHRLQPNKEYTFQVVAITSEGKCESKSTKRRTAKDGFDGDRAPLYQTPSKKEPEAEPPKIPHTLKKRKSLTNASLTSHESSPSPKAISVRAASASSSKVEQADGALLSKRSPTQLSLVPQRQVFDVGVAECYQLQNPTAKPSPPLPKIKYKLLVLQPSETPRRIIVSRRREKTPIPGVYNEIITARIENGPPKEPEPLKREEILRSGGNRTPCEERVEVLRPTLSAKSRASRTSDMSDLSLARSSTSVTKSLPKPKKYYTLSMPKASNPKTNSKQAKQLESVSPPNEHMTQRQTSSKKHRKKASIAVPAEARSTGVSPATDKKAMQAIVNLTSNAKELLGQVQSLNRLPPGMSRDSFPENGAHDTWNCAPDPELTLSGRRPDQAKEIAQTLTSLRLGNYCDQKFHPTASQVTGRSGLIDLDAALSLTAKPAPLPQAPVQRSGTTTLLPSTNRSGIRRNLDKLNVNRSLPTANRSWRPDFPCNPQAELSHNKFVPMQLRTQPANLPSSMQRQVSNLTILERGQSSLRMDQLARQTAEIDLRNPVFMYGPSYRPEAEQTRLPLPNTRVTQAESRLPSSRSTSSDTADSPNSLSANGNTGAPPTHPPPIQSKQRNSKIVANLTLSPLATNETQMQSAR